MLKFLKLPPIYIVEGHSVHSGKQSLSEGASERLIKKKIPSVSDRWVFVVRDRTGHIRKLKDYALC